MRNQILSQRRPRERGQTILFVALAMVSLLGMAALAIDVVTLYLARSEIQRAADAAALAAAKAVADSGFTTLPTTDPTLHRRQRTLLAQTHGHRSHQCFHFRRTRRTWSLALSLDWSGSPTVIDLPTRATRALPSICKSANCPRSFPKSADAARPTSPPSPQPKPTIRPTSALQFTPIAPTSLSHGWFANIGPNQRQFIH